MLTFTLFWICALIAAVICGVMIWSVATFGHTAAPANVRRRNRAAEVLWALVPILILISAATPAARMVMESTELVSRR